MGRIAEVDSWSRRPRLLASSKMWLAIVRLVLGAAIGATAMTSSNADTRRDARDILQLLLNAPQLSQFYHFDLRPQRVPLKIVNTTSLDIDGTDLTAAGQKAVLSREHSDTAIEITDFKIVDDAADIAFAFRAEGVVGKGTFKRTQGTWRLDKLNAAER